MGKIAEIIKYEGDNSTFIWKHPCEDFNSLTQLIVHESQEAIFFMNGQALDLFGPGNYTLENQNIPMLGKALNRITGGKTPFHCEVYFINKAVHMGMKWGTDSRVHFVDPITGLPLDIGASGELNLRVIDSRKLLISLVGTGTELSAKDGETGKLFKKNLFSAEATAAERQKSIQACFRAPLMTQIKSYLASVIRDQKINILEADAHMDALSDELHKRINPAFEAYGLNVSQFYITTISLPEDDRNFQEMRALISKAYLGVKTEEVKRDIASAEQQRRLVEEQTEAQLRILRAQSQAEAAKLQGLAEAEIMRAKGYTQKDILETDVQKAYAESMGKFGSNVGAGGGNGGGGLAGDLVGMMASMKVAETMFAKMDSAFTPSNGKSESATPQSETWICSCGETANTKNFCMNCGQPKPKARFCGNCGQELVDSGNFCPNCGSKI